MMIPQDILNVLSGPQGWSIIVGCILVLLLVLVYRRIGKLATNTQRDFSELREAMDILGARLDAARQMVEVQPTPVSEEVFAADDMALEPESSVSDAAVVPASVTADVDTGLKESEVEAASEPEEPLVTDLADAADSEPEPAFESFAFATPESSDDVFEAIGDDLPPDALDGAGEVVDDELPGVDETQAGLDDESFGFEVPVPDDTAQTEDDGFPMQDEDSWLAEQSQDAADMPEDSGDFLFGGGDAVAEPPTDADEHAEETVVPEMEEQGGAEQPAESETEPVADAFQFSAPDTTEEPETALSDGDEGQDFEATATNEQSRDIFPPAATDEPEVAEAPQDEVFADSSDTVHPPSVGPLEASSEVPPQPVEAAATPPSPSPSIPGLEPLPGNPDKPDVGVARCRECGRKIAYPKRLSGKRMRCPACRSAAVLP
ncbi:hypothetical protein Pcar_2738 [Syntrophotalea carbinolica DSM 2380]|uniref:Uncharacterized protein n=1 Tax=Syntrophotalea carbinolica (strain DSM 2380 / NBRC 103641 / GraBd1) TaxID=338963 RepID=Q3A0Y4_SYNC1|nr:hypothetical protein [Syntrophotalea carbinolica]ABA89973.1 hypothetical protein Pcar_2738 [Syntrophotalea carbinolica DSM 2380]